MSVVPATILKSHSLTERHQNMSTGLPYWASEIIVFDTETTGVRVFQDRIVTAMMGVLDAEGGVVEKHEWLLDPGVPIPAIATSVHGITTAEAQRSGVQARTGIEQIVTTLSGLLSRGLPLVAYNAPFDLTLLRAEAARHDIHWPNLPEAVIDPLVLDKQVDRYRKGKRQLEVVASHYGVVMDAAHEADADAIAAGRVLQEIARRYAKQLPEDLAELHRSQVRWANEQAESFRAFLERNGRDARSVSGEWPLRTQGDSLP